MIDVQNLNDVPALINSVDDAVGATPGTVTAGERPEQRLANPVRAHRERGFAELKHRGGHGLR